MEKSKNRFLQHHSPDLSDAYSSQARLGWFQEVLGLLSHKWVDIQHLYLQ